MGSGRRRGWWRTPRRWRSSNAVAVCIGVVHGAGWSEFASACTHRALEVQANNNELATVRRQGVLLLSVPVFFLKKRHTMREGDPASSKPSGMASAFSCTACDGGDVRGDLILHRTVFFSQGSKQEDGVSCSGPQSRIRQRLTSLLFDPPALPPAHRRRAASAHRVRLSKWLGAAPPTLWQ